MGAEPKIDLDRELFETAKAVLGQMEDMHDVDGLRRLAEERLKVLAAGILLPGSDTPIEDTGLIALDYIWELGGDLSYSSAQSEPFRPRALDYYVGRKIRHVWGTGELVRLSKKKEHTARYGIRVRLRCAGCGKRTTTVYAQPGCHLGAFCYIYDRQGAHLADLRNQEFRCPSCSSQ